MTQNSSVALLLEDEAIIAFDVEQALEEAGFLVTTNVTCSAADEWLRNTRPDDAVVDIRLKDGSSEGDQLQGYLLSPASLFDGIAVARGCPGK